MPPKTTVNKTSAKNFEISSTSLENEFNLVVELGELKGKRNSGLAIVDRKSDGRRLIRKKIAHQRIRTFGNRILGPIQLGIQQLIRHPNICEFVVADLDARTKDVTLYMEICDLGTLEDLLYNREKPFSEEPDTQDDKLPFAFGWHLFLQLLDVMCYLAYGYSTRQEILETDGVKEGWDPVIHQDLYDRNIFLKTPEVGRYPTIVVGDLDQCHSKSESTKEYLSELPNGNPDRAWWKRQQLDLHSMFGIMRKFTLRLNGADAKTMMDLVASFYTDGRSMANGFRSGFDVRADARSALRSVIDAQKESGVSYEPLQQVLRRPFDDLIAEAERQKAESLSEERTKKRKPAEPEGGDDQDQEADQETMEKREKRKPVSRQRKDTRRGLFNS